MIDTRSKENPLGYTLLVASAIFAVIYYKNVLQDTGSILLLLGAVVLITMYSAVKVGDVWRQEDDD